MININVNKHTCGYLIANTQDGRCRCNALSHQPNCRCNGEHSRCEVVDLAIQHIKDNHKELDYTSAHKIVKQNESVNGIVYEPFQWVPYHIDQPKDNGSVQNFLVCIKGHSVSNGQYIIKTVLFGKDFQLSEREKQNLLFWARVAPPRNLIDKDEAVKKLQACGILNKEGELNDAYKDILVKVEEK